MGNIENLFLYEEIMLLALRDEEGTIASGTLFNYAIGGSILAELLLNKRISIAQSKRRKLISIINSEPFNDPLIDESMFKIANSKRRATIENWVSRIANTKNLKHRAAQQLCNRGILRADEDTILLIFTRKIYPEINPEPEKKIIERLRSAIFTDTDCVDPRTIILISIANSTNILRAIFEKKKLKERKKRIEQIVNGEVTGKATKEAIAAMQAAVMVACIMPAMMTTVISSSSH